MSAPRIPFFTLMWSGKNVSTELSPYVTQLSYTDNVAGESDELSLSFEDVDGNWKNAWYPEKKDRVSLQFGYHNLMVDGGTFIVDEIALSGPPDVADIRALAAGVNSPIRTKISSAHEGKTLKQIAETIAGKHGMTVLGEIQPIRINRVTQNRESDLAFLKRLADEYGYLFSIRDNTLVFTAIDDIEKGEPVAVIELTEMISYSFTDKTISTFAATTIQYSDPNTAEVFAYTEKDPKAESVDSQELRVKAENQQQAEVKAKAAQSKKNTEEITASFSLPGNPLLVAGSNILISGLGKISGKYHILQSNHTITRGGGYTTFLSVKRVGEGAKQQPKPAPVQQNAQVIYSQQ